MMVRLGCRLKTVEEWDANFWDNEKEFPNDGSKKSNDRWCAYQMARAWCVAQKECLQKEKK